MSPAQAAHVQRELSEQLKEFSSWERMTTEYDQLLRAVYKEFHHGGRYYKGKSADFASWMLEHHPETFYMHIERADGGRQACRSTHCNLSTTHPSPALFVCDCNS